MFITIVCGTVPGCAENARSPRRCAATYTLPYVCTSSDALTGQPLNPSGTGLTHVVSLESRSGESRSGLSRSGESRSGESRSGLSRSGESKSGESRSGESRSGLSRSGESRSGESRSGESRSGADRSCVVVSIRRPASVAPWAWSVFATANRSVNASTVYCVGGLVSRNVSR